MNKDNNTKMDYKNMSLQNKIEMMKRYNEVFHDMYTGLSAEAIILKYNLTEANFIELLHFFLRLSNNTMSLRDRYGSKPKSLAKAQRQN